MINIENYNSEYQRAVEQRMKRPIIDVSTVSRKDPETGEDREVNVVDIAGVTVESLALKEEIQEIIRQIHPTKDALELLQTMVFTFRQKRGLITEAETSRGKTYLTNRFLRLIFGRDAKPVDFYCNGQTDTMSLMAKWVPNTGNPEDEKKWEDWTASGEGKNLYSTIINKAREGNGMDDIRTELVSLARKAGITTQVAQWELQLGALPKAMTMPVDPFRRISEDNPSRGTFLHMQEVGLAETQVVDALLQLGGEKGRLSTEIQLWDDGGRIIEAGPYFWVHYSTNPPENYANRQGLDQALARRNTFYKPAAESAVSRQLRMYLDNDVPFDRMPESLQKEVLDSQKQMVFPVFHISEEENIYTRPEYIGTRVIISDVLADFHEKLKTDMRDKKIENRPKQRFELTDDDWNMVYDFMRKFPTADIEATLDRAVMLHYINRFTDKGQQEALKLWQEVKRQKEFKQRIEGSMAQTYITESDGEVKYFPIPLKLEDQTIPSGTLMIKDGKPMKYLGRDIETFKSIFVPVSE